MTSPSAEDGPLTGIRVIDLTQNVLGPLATTMLGDLGAEVIKIESPQGDPVRELGAFRAPQMGSYFLAINRNKKSVVLDLKSAAGREALLALAAGADVLVHNLRLGAMARLGLDYAALAARNPRIIYAGASGYRKGGPLEERAAYDDVIQGESGFAAMNRSPDGSPRYVPFAITDKIVGVALAGAVGMALFHRERTGRGQEINVPMLEFMTGFNMVEHAWDGMFGEPEKGFGYPRMVTPHRRPYATSDGYICLLATTDEQWRRLLVAIDRAELNSDPRFSSIAARTRNIDTLYAVLVEAVLQRSTAEWQERLTKADIPIGEVKELRDLLTDPYLLNSGFYQRFDDPEMGEVYMSGVAMAFSDSPGRVRSLAPRLGEHTSAILGELGMSEAEIAAAQGGRK